MAISFSSEPEQTPISLAPTVPALPQDVAEKRAADASYALATELPYKDPDQIKAQIVSGDEQSLRDEASATINNNNKVHRNKALLDYLKTSAAPMPDDVFSFIDQQKKEDTEARSVLEESFAKKFTESLNKSDEEYLKEWGLFNPAQIELFARGGIAQDRYLQSKMQELQTRIEGESGLQSGFQIAKGMLPFYGEVQQRGNVPGVGALSPFLKGSNVEEQRHVLRSKGFTKEFKDIVDAATNESANPYQAMEWVQSMYGNHEWLADNFSTAMDMTNIPVVGIAKSLLNLPKNVAKTALTLNVANSMRQAAKAAADGIVTNQVASATGAGDLAAASVLRIRGSIAEASMAAESQSKEAMDALSTAFNYRHNEIAANPGNFGAEGANRLLEEEDAFKAKMFQIMLSSSKVDRDHVQANINKILEGFLTKASEDLGQPDNSILNIVPYKNSFTNTWHYDYHFGTEKGTYFPTWIAAKGYINNKLGSLKNFAEVTDRGAGLGWYVKLRRDLKETDPIVRDLLQTGTSKYPETRLTKALGSWLTPEEHMSIEDNLNRKVVAYSASLMRGAFKEEMTRIRKLAKSRGNFEYTKPGMHVGYETAAGDKYSYNTGRDPSGLWEKPTDALTSTTRTLPTGEARPSSEHTVYIKPEHASVLPEEGKSFRLVANHETGMLERHGPNPTTGWAKKTETPYSINPEIGSHPVQLFLKSGSGSLKGVKGNAYNYYVQGAPITKMVKTPDEVLRLTGRQRYEQFSRALDYAVNAVDPKNPEKRGYWFQSPGQLEDFYLRNFQRVPDADEVHGYFAYVRNSDLDWVNRNTQMYKFFLRLGTTEHSISTTNAEGKKVTSDRMLTIASKELPNPSKGDDGILYVLSDGTVKSYTRGRFGDKKFRTELKEKVAQGQIKNLRIVNPDDLPLKKFLEDLGQPNTEQRFRYILAEEHEEHPLRYSLVPYRGGPHAIYDADHYIKQAKMMHGNGVSRYVGDNTLSAVSSKLIGEELLPKLEGLRHAYREDRRLDFNDLAASIGVDADMARKWFRERGFSVDEPFRLVPKNKKIINLDSSLRDRHGDAFEDGTRAGSEARQFGVEFMGERDAEDLRMFDNLGSQQNPVYKWDPAPRIDPLSTLNRAFTRLINASSSNDYKISAVENWIKEALNNKAFTKKESTIWHSPFYYFEHAEEEFASALEDKVRNKLLATRHQIRQLVYVSDNQENFVHRLAQSLADTIYGKFGNPEGYSGFARKALLTPPWLVHTIADAPTFLRNRVFDAYVGGFNPYQFLVQASTWANVAGIAGPGRALQAVPAYLMHSYSRFNMHPNILAGMDKLMGNFGWKPGEFIEANQAFIDSGFNKLGGSYLLMDHMLQPGFVKTKWGGFMDMASFFFKEGELSTRAGAYFAAYKEFRETHPTGALSDRDWNFILNRADLMTGSMSKASKSRIQEGTFSIPAQFLGYKLRMVELMAGHRITGAEKLRMMAVYGTLFGMPAALGVAPYTGAVPAGEALRIAGTALGYAPGENWIKSLFMEGVPSMAIAYLTGDPNSPDKQKRGAGFFNVGSKLASSTGLDPIHNALMEDGDLWKILAGAAGGYGWSVLGTFHPYAQVFLDPKNFQLTWDDVMTTARSMSSGLDHAAKSYIAYQTGIWASKQGTVLATDVTKLQAVISGLTGFQRQDIQNTWLTKWLEKGQEGTWKTAENRFIQEWTRGMQNAVAGNAPEATINMKNAYSYLTVSGFPIERYTDAIKKATLANKSLIDRIDYSYWMKNVPPEDKARRQQIWNEIQMMKGPSR